MFLDAESFVVLFQVDNNINIYGWVSLLLCVIVFILDIFASKISIAGLVDILFYENLIK